MKTKIFLFLLFITTGLITVYLSVRVQKVYAGDEACGAGSSCYAQRVINQWSCNDCNSWGYRCIGTDITCNISNPTACSGYGGRCERVCLSNGGNWGSCDRLDMTVQCDRSPGVCRWQGVQNNCNWYGNTCTEQGQNLIYGCCGPGGSTPTQPPSCTGTWSNGACGGGGCAPEYRLQTEVLSPPGCRTPGTRCVYDSTCVPSCNCPGWVAGACGGGSPTLTCPPTQRYFSMASPGCVDSLGNGNCAPGSACCVNQEKCEPDPTCTTAMSCVISLPSVSLSSIGEVTNPDPTVSIISQTGGTISNVTFSVDNPAIANMTGTYPNPDTTAAFQTELQLVSFGTTTYRAVAVMNDGVSTCNAAGTVSGIPSAWWQVVGGDVAAGGSITSTIPNTCTLPGCSPVFIKDSPTGNPGATLAGGATTFGTGTVSSRGWRANTSMIFNQPYSYTYFYNKIPSGVTPASIGTSTIDGNYFESGGTFFGGYYWYQYTGGSDLTVTGNSVDLSNRRVILFVGNGRSLNLQTKILMTTRGRSGFYAIINGNVLVDPVLVGHPPVSPSTPDIEGVFYVDSQFFTGTTGVGDNQLHVRGSVIGYGYSGGTPGVNDGVVPERDLTDDSLYPGEIFEFGPELVIAWPPYLTSRNLSWKEVSP